MTHNFIKLQIKLIKPLNFIFITVETYIKQYVFSETIRKECHFTEYHMTLSRGRGFRNLLYLLCERIYNLMKSICVYIFIGPGESFTYMENLSFLWVQNQNSQKVFDKNNRHLFSKFIGHVVYIYWELIIQFSTKYSIPAQLHPFHI